MVLSAILAQSFMMVNLPCKIVISPGGTECIFTTHDDTVLADLDVISDGGCLDNRVGSDVDIVSDLHRIVVEISAVCFIWWSGYSMRVAKWTTKRRKKGRDLMTHPSPTRQYRPKEMTTACPGPVRRRSPRIIAPLEMMVFPPRMMFCGPAIVARRDTLFPVSYKRLSPL
jgi:hypothetical protein